MGLPAHAFGPINMDMTVKDYKAGGAVQWKEAYYAWTESNGGLIPRLFRSDC